MSLIQQLKKRNLLQDISHEEELTRLLEKDSVTFYCGFDPTSDSLHVGSLLPLVTMRRFAAAGHRPIALLGAATGMIGDPSGKSEERLLLGEEQIEKNLAGLKQQIESLLAIDDLLVVRNDSWLKDVTYIEFLRDVGKHFSVNAMVARDSVKTRLEQREQGISYTEFSYMLLQAYDFYWLNKHHNCRLQIGGSDQWGNIASGLDLIRRRAPEKHPQCYGLTFPLLTTASGTKFGKTEAGTVWLDAKRTSPYDFYQFWLNVPDADVLSYVNTFTDLADDELESLREATSKSPQDRLAQKALAGEMTRLVHGEEHLEEAQKKTEALFSNASIKDLDSESIRELMADVPVALTLAESDLTSGLTIQDLVVQAKLASSKGAARRLVEGGGVYINDEGMADFKATITKEQFIEASFLILRSGKKKKLKISLSS